MKVNSFNWFTGGINMIKKLVAGTLILFVLGTSNTLSYATPINTNNNQSETKKAEVAKPFFEVIDPEKDIVTSDKTIVLSFRASEGTNVYIEVYHNTSKDEKTEDYVLSYDPIKVTIGAFQRGWASIDLKSGLNKIKFTAEYKNGSKDKDVRIINVMDVKEVKQLLQDIVNKSTLGIGKKL